MVITTNGGQKSPLLPDLGIQGRDDAGQTSLAAGLEFDGRVQGVFGRQQGRGMTLDRSIAKRQRLVEHAGTLRGIFSGKQFSEQRAIGANQRLVGRQGQGSAGSEKQNLRQIVLGGRDLHFGLADLRRGNRLSGSQIGRFVISRPQPGEPLLALVTEMIFADGLRQPPIGVNRLDLPLTFRRRRDDRHQRNRLAADRAAWRQGKGVGHQLRSCRPQGRRLVVELSRAS